MEGEGQRKGTVSALEPRCSQFRFPERDSHGPAPTHPVPSSRSREGTLISSQGHGKGEGDSPRETILGAIGKGVGGGWSVGYGGTEEQGVCPPGLGSDGT